MSDVIDIHRARLEVAVRKGFRNWKTRLKEGFGVDTRLEEISDRSLAFLALGREESSFYLFDLIMQLQGLGSGFELPGLASKHKMIVMERHLFLLDRVRYEYMKRLGWLASYPGEDCTIVDFVVRFDELAPLLQARTPEVSPTHPAYDRFRRMNAFKREEFVRTLIPKALKEIPDYSTTL